VARHEAQKIYAKESCVTHAENFMMALNGADTLVIVNDWKEFRSPDFDAIKSKLQSAVIFDGSNLHEPALVRGQGLEYLAIGQ
jgi:UDPglucose 6-dehydrogenase